MTPEEPKRDTPDEPVQPTEEKRTAEKRDVKPRSGDTARAQSVDAWKDYARRPVVWGSALALLALILLISFWPFGGSPGASSEEENLAFQEQRDVQLFFPGNSLLEREKRSIASRDAVEEEVRQIVELLLKGPETENLHRPLPEGIELAAVYLHHGVAYVDLHRPEEVPPLSMGSAQEMGAIFSLVNSIALNVPGVGSVVLLWDGRQLPTFAGHLDTSRPLSANMHLVAN